MVQAPVAVEPTPTASTDNGSVVMHPVNEAAHLRTIIETQPACVMRVSLKGVLLALNDAAVEFLGATDLAQLLNTNLCDRLSASRPEWWTEFVGGAGASGSSSGAVECELLDPAGAMRPVALLGRALLNHPDGVPSLLVTIRDMAGARQREASLQREEADRRAVMDTMAEQHRAALAAREREAFEALAQWRAEADAATVAQEQLRTAIDAAEADRRELRAALDRAQGERQMLQAAVDQADAVRRQTQAALDQHIAANAAFDAALRTREAKWQRMVAEQATARASAEGALADARTRIDQLQKALASVFDAATSARQSLQRDGQA